MFLSLLTISLEVFIMLKIEWYQQPNGSLVTMTKISNRLKFVFGNHMVTK